MGKKSSESYLDWKNLKTIYWGALQSEKHPQILELQIPTMEMIEDHYKTGRDFTLWPGKPNPPADGSDWTHFLPCDWDAWLFYYEIAKRNKLNISIGDVVRIITDDNYYIKMPLMPSSDYIKNDEYNRACYKVKNEFRKARDRINEMEDIPDYFPDCPPGSDCSECPEYQKCGKFEKYKTLTE